MTFILMQYYQNIGKSRVFRSHRDKSIFKASISKCKRKNTIFGNNILISIRQHIDFNSCVYLMTRKIEVRIYVCKCIEWSYKNKMGWNPISILKRKWEGKRVENWSRMKIGVTIVRAQKAFFMLLFIERKKLFSIKNMSF